MIPSPARILSLGLALGLVLAACAPLPAQNVYLLDETRHETSGTQNEASKPVLEVAGILMPDYLDTSELTRREGERLLISPEGRWGERLSVGLRRSLASHLAGELPRLSVASTQPLMPPRYRLFITIETLDAQEDGRLELVARWSLLEEHAHEPLVLRKTVVIEQADAPSDEALVATTNRALRRLSQDIAQTVRRKTD